MRTKKYAIHPGYIRSRHDRDEHFITASQLAELYGVSLLDAVVCQPDNMKYGSHNKEIIHLYPRFDGKYEKIKS